ncbi:MAG: hypothetical protein IJJ44_04275 [Solobacterium sp.]|nr:hypothetical protein [Solobacterium sp.]
MKKNIITLCTLLLVFSLLGCEKKKSEVTFVTNADIEESPEPEPEMDFLEPMDYEIVGNSIKLMKVQKDIDYLEILPEYMINGEMYTTDLSELNLGKLGLKTVVFLDGITELPDNVFNGSDIQHVYFPASMACVYDIQLDYMNPENGKKIEVFYEGDENMWNSIFTVYEIKNATFDNSTPEEVGASWAHKLNKWVGGGYDPDEYLYYYNISLEQMRILENR